MQSHLRNRLVNRLDNPLRNRPLNHRGSLLISHLINQPLSHLCNRLVNRLDNPLRNRPLSHRGSLLFNLLISHLINHRGYLQDSPPCNLLANQQAIHQASHHIFRRLRSRIQRSNRLLILRLGHQDLH